MRQNATQEIAPKGGDYAQQEIVCDDSGDALSGIHSIFGISGDRKSVV